MTLGKSLSPHCSFPSSKNELNRTANLSGNSKWNTPWELKMYFPICRYICLDGFSLSHYMSAAAQDCFYFLNTLWWFFKKGFRLLPYFLSHAWSISATVSTLKDQELVFSNTHLTLTLIYYVKLNIFLSYREKIKQDTSEERANYQRAATHSLDPCSRK